MKKIYILIQTDEGHAQKVDIFGTRIEAEIAMRKAFLITLRPDTRPEDEGDFYRVHNDWAWMSGDVSRGGWEYDWHIWEKEVQL